MVDLGRIAHQIDQSRGFWRLVDRQHGVITRQQLLAFGLGPDSIKRRVAAGRLHCVRTGVYAVGRPGLPRHGLLMAAVLSCGPEAVLSHGSAAELWGIRPVRTGWIEVSVPNHVRRRPQGILVHRRTVLGSSEVTQAHGIPLTAPICTLIDIATHLERDQIEAAVNEADRHGLTDPEELRAALEELPPRPGTRALKATLDRRTFTLTDSELERRFLRLVRELGLPKPRTGQRVNGFKVDFHWPDLGLVVETDGLRYHRTPAQQARDRIRDQAHTARGLTPLRFTRAQVRFEPERVRAVLTAVAERLRTSSRAAAAGTREG